MRAHHHPGLSEPVEDGPAKSPLARSVLDKLGQTGWVLTLLLTACATTPEPVVTKPQPGLIAEPTRTSTERQLPEALRVDPTKIVAKPMDLELKQPELVTLPNGLTLYLLEDHTTPLVLVRAMLPIGTVDEPADKLGLTVVTAALLAEGGAGKRSPDELDELLEFHGANLGSGAGEENSQVSLSVRSEDVTTLLPVFADVLQRPRFEAARFDVSINRFLESIRRREDRPDGVAARALGKAVFGPSSPLAREATEATVKAITLADVKKLYATHFGPKRTRLVITGDFDRKTLVDAVKKELGSWKGGEPPARSWAKTEPLQRRVIIVPRKVAQAKVRLGGPGYVRGSPLEFPLRLANTSLGTFGIGRLYREIRDERGLAYSAYSSVGPGPTTGLFQAGFDTKPEQVAEALEVATRLIHDLGTSAPLTDAELSTARDVSVNAFAFRFDTPSKIAWERATYDFFGYPQNYLATWRDRIGAVTAAQASEASRQFDDGLQIVIVGPPEKLGDLSRFGPVSTITDVEQFR